MDNEMMNSFPKQQQNIDTRDNDAFIPTRQEIKLIQDALIEVGKTNLSLYKSKFENLYVKIAEKTKIC